MKRNFDKNKIVYDDGEMQLTEWEMQQILKSEEDIEEGRIRNAREVFKELEDKYGF